MMITASERQRLEQAYPMESDARPVLRSCAVGLFAVFMIATAAGLIGGGAPADRIVAKVSAQQAANGH